MASERFPWSSGLNALVVCTLVIACKADPEPDGDSVGDGSSDGSSDTAESTDTSAGTTTTSDSSASGECVFWLEDNCMDPDLKCMPWSEKPDRIPDEARCCELDPNPVSFGDRCTVKDYDGSCLDDCPANALCVIDEFDGLQGYCQAFCEPGNPDACPPNEICKAFFEMIEAVETVPVCMARCDPLLQDCESFGRPGWSCLPEGASSPSFLCMPPVPNPKFEGEPCLLQNDCAVGLSCVPASAVDQVFYSACSSAFFCCTPYCDLSEPNSCAGTNVCVDLESDIPGFENVGVCALPA